MKKIILTVMAVFGLIALTACSAEPKDKTKEVVLNVEEVAKEIMTAGGMDVQNALDAATLGLDETQVKSFAAFAGTEEDANRVYLFELSAPEHEADIKYIGEKEQDANIIKFTSTGGDAFEVAKASRVLVKGNYVLYLAVPNYEEAKAVFTSKFE